MGVLHAVYVGVSTLLSQARSMVRAFISAPMARPHTLLL